ncbi:MAG: UDP-N-acetylmuramoyl-L-alanyl-D-glutamate--2,6-diaminopimelate ligase [Gammaproteobacteria bacterium]|nr:UDP-N-acetylmuramoyl-L-alanyl-D-glutamate--2,6-diaminopimelate ligase [Gammaproteobacteria bacterium]
MSQPNSMLLTDLLRRLLPETELEKLEKITIKGISLDNRTLDTDWLFVALNGSQCDGRRFSAAALKQGAAAVLSELAPEQVSYVELTADGAIVHLSDLVAQLSQIAGDYYGQPSQHLTLIGVTGTNGKTTVTQLIAQWLELLGQRAYTLGTLGNGFIEALEPSINTTLNAIDVQRHLAQAVAAGASYAVMEVSSHGLALHRIADLTFDVAAFTNLSRDHLDFHGDMAGYAAAKQQLFSAKHCLQAVLNGQDPVARQWLEQWDSKVKVSCFNQRQPDVEQYLVATNVSYHTGGIDATIVTNQQQGQLSSQLLGAFNLENILAALNILVSAGFTLEQLLELAPQLSPVAGRMEAFSVAGLPTVVVDYAHTSDALVKALQALRVHCDNELVVMFGCGGDRDQGKRPLMAAAAEQYADKVIFTQDNSRSESPQLIIEQMFAGIQKPAAIKVELERTKAVELAIKMASANDIVLLAGKGHEDYQLLGAETLDYDERVWAQKVLARLSKESIDDRS